MEKESWQGFQGKGKGPAMMYKGKQIGNKKGILRSISVNSTLFYNVQKSANKDFELLQNDFLAAGLCSMDYDTTLRLNYMAHSLNSYT